MSVGFEPTPTSTSESALAEVAPGAGQPLLAALGRVVRGLSALFWGLPLALVACVQTARGDLLRPLGVLPPVVTTLLLLYGLSLLGHFQKQERPWRNALELARLLAVVNVGFSPFLFWWNKVPAERFFESVVQLMTFTGLLFLLALNQVLRRLTAMLPDETLRVETRVFTKLNRGLLSCTMLVMLGYFIAERLQPAPPWLRYGLGLLDRVGPWLPLLLVLVPVAMTMALLWKTKEVILTSIFGSEL